MKSAGRWRQSCVWYVHRRGRATLGNPIAVGAVVAACWTCWAQGLPLTAGVVLLLAVGELLEHAMRRRAQLQAARWYGAWFWAAREHWELEAEASRARRELEQAERDHTAEIERREAQEALEGGHSRRSAAVIGWWNAGGRLLVSRRAAGWTATFGRFGGRHWGQS